MISSRWRQSDTPSYEAMVELAREASVHPWGFTCSRCVSNLHKKQPDDHVKRIAQFSMDAIAAANSVIVDEEDPKLGHVNIRVGFHSGE